MKALLKEQLQAYADQYAQNKARDELLKELVKQVEDVTFDEAEVKVEIDIAVEGFARQLEQRGMSLEGYLQACGRTREEMDAELRPQAEDTIKARMALNEVCRLEGITVTQEEVDQAYADVAAMYRVSVQEVKDAYEAGFTHVSHFYNGMPGFHKNREYKYEGTVESVYLIDDITIELIADGRHLPDTILRLASKVKGVEKTCLVTASLAYAGVDAKEVDDPNIIIEDGVCKSRDLKQLVGSIATMDVLVQNMVKAGVPLEDVLRMASETPAKIMGVYDKKGSLEKGKDADILILDKKLRIRSAWSKGQMIEGI